MAHLNIAPEIKTSPNFSTLPPIDSTFAATILSTAGVGVIVALYIHYLVLKMSKRGNSLMDCLLPDMALNTLVGCPVWFIFICTVISLPEPPKEAIGTWFCHAASIVAYIWLFRVWIYSLLVSLLRYLYVVHNQKITAYGLTRIGRIFRILFWLVPAGLVALQLSLRTEYDPTPWINRCYGWISEPSFGWYEVERQFCAYNDYGFSNRYIEYGLRVLCGINAGVCILLFSNLIEAVIYYRVYAHLKT